MLSFAEFEKYIKNLQDYDDLRTNLSSERFYFESGIIDDLVGNIVALLEEVMHDKEDGWISYWCWELDFGRKWKPGTITDEGRDIKLQTIADLHVYLLNNMYESSL